MLKTPLKNSKNVSKQFQSPLNTPICKKERIEKIEKKNKILKLDCKTSIQSPLSTRNLDAKRILLLNEDENEKKRKITDDEIKMVPENATKTDLLVLKRKIFEIRQELDRIKSRESCAKKNDPKELRLSINKWKSACQNTLQIICSELKQNGQNLKISDILYMLGIPETVVHYSKNDDTFI